MQSKRAAGVPNAPPATIWAIMWTSARSKSARGTLAAWPAPTRPAFRASRVHLARCVGRVNRLPSRRSGGARRVTTRPVSDEDPVGKNLHFPPRAAHRSLEGRDMAAQQCLQVVVDDEAGPDQPREAAHMESGPNSTSKRAKSAWPCLRGRVSKRPSIGHPRPADGRQRPLHWGIVAPMKPRSLSSRQRHTAVGPG